MIIISCSGMTTAEDAAEAVIWQKARHATTTAAADAAGGIKQFIFIKKSAFEAGFFCIIIHPG